MMHSSKHAYKKLKLKEASTSFFILRFSMQLSLLKGNILIQSIIRNSWQNVTGQPIWQHRLTYSFFVSSGSSSNYFTHVVYVGFLEAVDNIPRTRVLFLISFIIAIVLPSIGSCIIINTSSKVGTNSSTLCQSCENICSIEKLITLSPSVCISVIQLSQESLSVMILQPSYRCRIILD